MIVKLDMWYVMSDQNCRLVMSDQNYQTKIIVLIKSARLLDDGSLQAARMSDIKLDMLLDDVSS